MKTSITLGRRELVEIIAACEYRLEWFAEKISEAAEDDVTTLGEDAA